MLNASSAQSTSGRDPHAEAGLARRITDVFRATFGRDFPLGVRAWDGSRSGPADAPVILIKAPGAIRHIVRSPGQRGLARAYVAGFLDVEGDPREALRISWQLMERIREDGMPPPREWPAVVRLLATLGAVGMPPVIPVEEAKLRGRPHTRARDRAAIAHHYDLGNDFYELLLDETMSYSCAYWKSSAPTYRLADAQRDKLDLICHQLELNSGTRLLDVGCGWGSLALYAAQHYGTQVTAVTVSERQAEFVRDKAQTDGLQDLIHVQVRDYRDIATENFDAVASIEMGEHVGERNYPGFCRKLWSVLRPGGRLLLQQIARGDGERGGGPFIESYIAPDMCIRRLSATLAHIEAAGLEPRQVFSMREHYVRTADALLTRLDEVWDEVLYRYGARRARIWRLYLMGTSLAFDQNRLSVYQILSVRPPASDTTLFMENIR